MPLSANKMRRDPMLIETFTKGMCEAELTTGCSPPFSGALAWLNRHKDEINTTLRLVQMYPVLIQEECLDGLWTFIQPMLQVCARKEQGCQIGSFNDKVFGSWESADLPLSPQTRGNLLAPVVRPSLSVHGVDTTGLKVPESNPRATSASAAVPIIMPRAPSIGRSRQNSEDTRMSFDGGDNNGDQDMRKRALSCSSPVSSRRRGLVRRTDSSSSKGSSTGKPSQGSGHTSPDEVSTEMPSATSGKSHGENVVLPPIPNIESLQTRLTNRRQSLRRQTSLGYATNATSGDTTTATSESNQASGYDSRGMTPSMSETAYLVFRKSMNGTVHSPELVHWPLKKPETRRDSWMSNFWDDESEASLALDSNVTFDIDLRSESVTPDLM